MFIQGIDKISDIKNSIYYEIFYFKKGGPFGVVWYNGSFKYLFTFDINYGS